MLARLRNRHTWQWSVSHGSRSLTSFSHRLHNSCHRLEGFCRGRYHRISLGSDWDFHSRDKLIFWSLLNSATLNSGIALLTGVDLIVNVSVCFQPRARSAGMLFKLIPWVSPVMKLPAAYCLFADADVNLRCGKTNRMRSINTSACVSTCTHARARSHTACMSHTAWY